jgi:hypothetical protein
MAIAKIIGIYPIEGNAPVHLIELLVEGDGDAFDIGEVTQEVAGQQKSNWQAPYDEASLRNLTAGFATFFSSTTLITGNPC